MKKSKYKKELYELQVELVKFQKYVIEKEIAVCLLFEGRDAAGKDGTIKRFTEHLSPREARLPRHFQRGAEKTSCRTQDRSA